MDNTGITRKLRLSIAFTVAVAVDVAWVLPPHWASQIRKGQPPLPETLKIASNSVHDEPNQPQKV